MVEWKKLGDISDIGTGSNNREDACDNGQYPFYVRSKDVLRINSYLYDEEAILIPGEGGIGEIFHYVNGKYGLHQRTYRVHPVSKEVIGRYLYYYLFENFVSYIEQKSFKSTAASIRKPMLTGFPVAIPSVSEQQRIVGILDTFTASIDNLKEQIAQRRKQYEYYRDQLLDLEGKPGVEMKTLGEVCEISGDYGLSAPSKPYDGVRYLRITDITDSGGLNNEYVSADLKEDAGKEPLIDGDILFARTGATVGKTLVYRSNFGKCLFAGYLIRYRARKQIVFPQYLFHFTHSTKYYNWVSASLAVGAQPNISAQRYNQLQFPLPPLSEQQRIVSILDTFEASIQNLEAQLKQREKQYEYYRNKLLTFE